MLACFCIKFNFFDSEVRGEVNSVSKNFSCSLLDNMARNTSFSGVGIRTDETGGGAKIIAANLLRRRPKSLSNHLILFFFGDMSHESGRNEVSDDRGEMNGFYDCRDEDGAHPPVEECTNAVPEGPTGIYHLDCRNMFIRNKINNEPYLL